MSKSIGKIHGAGSMNPYGYETDYMQYLRGYNPYNYEQTLQNMSVNTANALPQYQADNNYSLTKQPQSVYDFLEQHRDLFYKLGEDGNINEESINDEYKTENAGSQYEYVDMNKGKIVPYTRPNGMIGYDLVDNANKPNWKQLLDLSTYKNMNFIKNMAKYYGFIDLKHPIYDAGNKDITRNVWEQLRQQCLRPYDNYLSGERRVEQLRNGNNLFLDVEYNPDANYNMPGYRSSSKEGKYYVNKYGEIIDKYAQKYNMDADLVKAVMYNEAATGHWLGLNEIADNYDLSRSQMPMNVRGDTWGYFDGEIYDTYNPEQNIILGVRLLKRLNDSINNPSPEKIGTLWNETGAMQINDYGARTKTIYDTKPWK